MCSHLAFTVERSPENGGDLTFTDYQPLEDAFAKQVRKLCGFENRLSTAHLKLIPITIQCKSP